MAVAVWSTGRQGDLAAAGIEDIVDGTDSRQAGRSDLELPLPTLSAPG